MQRTKLSPPNPSPKNSGVKRRTGGRGDGGTEWGRGERGGIGRGKGKVGKGKGRAQKAKAGGQSQNPPAAHCQPESGGSPGGGKEKEFEWTRVSPLIVPKEGRTIYR